MNKPSFKDEQIQFWKDKLPNLSKAMEKANGMTEQEWNNTLALSTLKHNVSEIERFISLSTPSSPVSSRRNLKLQTRLSKLYKIAKSASDLIDKELKLLNN